MNQELPNVQGGLRKGKGTIANMWWIKETARKFQKKKKSISALLTMLKPLTVRITAQHTV